MGSLFKNGLLCSRLTYRRIGTRHSRVSNSQLGSDARNRYMSPEKTSQLAISSNIKIYDPKIPCINIDQQENKMQARVIRRMRKSRISATGNHAKSWGIVKMRKIIR